MTLTVLYDGNCSLCTAIRGWLARQPQLVPMDFVAASSAEARLRFPQLDHERTLDEITVVGDDGAIYEGDRAWVMSLWATVTYRPLAERLSRPGMRPFVRAAAYAAAGLRGTGSEEEDDYIDNRVISNGQGRANS
jgi:predicted DCC family thiol-disulfide oxidoreductase YuxK